MGDVRRSGHESGSATSGKLRSKKGRCVWALPRGTWSIAHFLVKLNKLSLTYCDYDTVDIRDFRTVCPVCKKERTFYALWVNNQRQPLVAHE